MEKVTKHMVVYVLYFPVQQLVFLILEVACPSHQKKVDKDLNVENIARVAELH